MDRADSDSLVVTGVRTRTRARVVSPVLVFSVFGRFVADWSNLAFFATDSQSEPLKSGKSSLSFTVVAFSKPCRYGVDSRVFSIRKWWAFEWIVLLLV